MKYLFAILTLMMSLTARAEVGSSYLGLEVQPISLLSLVPGVDLYRGGLELGLSPHVAIMANYTHIAVDSDKISDADDTSEDIRAAHLKGKSMGAGLRLYPGGGAEGIYLGAGVEEGAIKGDLTYEEKRYEGEGESRIANAELGYRWLWNSGINMRLGALGTKAIESSNSFKTADGETLPAKKRQELNRNSKLADENVDINFDVAFGYVF